jgi:hypothetical protein
MTFLEQLQAHKGGLIRLKTQLFWYEGRGWDNTPGRICLLLDAAATAATTVASSAAAATTTAAHLLIDGKPAWIWVAEQDIELLVNDQPTN